MNREELLEIIKKLSTGYKNKIIVGQLFSYTVESLIMTNLDLVPELEELADYLAQFDENATEKYFYSREDLIHKLIELKLCD
ncbi:hypothetical protein JXM83_02430 [Candidatus Woesearchaeota archaeon]|nr:hypothetical protein [Candidatus Woesearchaeota archaeon]